MTSRRYKLSQCGFVEPFVELRARAKTKQPVRKIVGEDCGSLFWLDVTRLVPETVSVLHDVRAIPVCPVLDPKNGDGLLPRHYAGS
jgi:hypothetical protein